MIQADKKKLICPTVIDLSTYLFNGRKKLNQNRLQALATKA